MPSPEQAYIDGVLNMARELREAAVTLHEAREVNRETCRLFARSGKLTDEQLALVREAYPPGRGAGRGAGRPKS
jgi:hypothetical protein